MGADGGSVVSRQDLVAGSKKAQEPTLGVACEISKRPLNYQQLVCDYYGRLYNKEPVLEYLIGKSKSIPQLRTLKDIVTLDPRLVNRRWVCPISNKDIVEEFGSSKFAAATCGHIVQAELLQEKCPVCEKSVSCAIVLGAQGADLARQKQWALDLKKKRVELKRRLRK